MAVAAVGLIAAMRPAVTIDITPDGHAWVAQPWRGRPRPLPDTIIVERGGRPRIRIRNDDVRTHLLGIFRAPAASTVEYALPGPGSYSGLCSLHQRQTFTVVVR